MNFEIHPQEVKRQIDAGEKIKLIDVREPQEHQICRIAGAELIPMGAVPQHLTRLEDEAEEAKLVVLCHHGMRSLNVVAWLRDKGVANCVSMSGGIDAWSLLVDSQVPRY